MADKDDIKEGKDFGVGIPQVNKPFYVKGAGALDWGMQNRLARIFNPASGRTVMLETKVDPNIVGGVIARIGSTVYDGSVVRQLEKMKQGLVESM